MMNVWRPASISEEPEVTLSNWKIMLVEGKDLHLVGFNINLYEGRTSSKIVEFDLNKLTAKTKSGRIYQLVGEPGVHGDAMYVWDAWCRVNKVEFFEELTVEQLKEKHERASN